ncbi:MAG: DUF2723 domain-containing protein [Muribaculaceae bacterium]|nr:DUF2723 domain-containing protein [Muribaculaceae bacterium]
MIRKKVTVPSHLSGAFRLVLQSRSHRYAPSSQAKNHSEICDPGINKYWGSGSVQEKKYLPAGPIAAWTAFALLLATYWLTVAPSVSYWDCPEYVAAATGLEVGHPPGNPTWMLVERVVTMLAPSPEYAALAVNLSSGVFTAFAAFFLALTIFRVALWILLKLPRRHVPAPITAAGGALVGALAFGWCDSVWFSAVEAEVYAMSIFMTSLCLWLMCKWAGTRSRTDSWRLLILIAYLFGLSIGVHQLNLLIIPVLALIWGVRRGIRSPFRLAFIFLISLLCVACVLVGMMPSTIAIAAKFELIAVNQLGLPQLSGVVIYVLLLGVSLLSAIAVTRRSADRRLIAIVCYLPVLLSGIFVFSDHFLLGEILSAVVCVLLVSGKHFQARRMTLAIWMLAFLLTGYASYALIPIRGDVASPANAVMPGNPFAFASYQSREQYGSKPLLYGATPYSRPMFAEDYDSEGNTQYRRYAVERYADIYVPKLKDGRLPADRASILSKDSARNAALMERDGDAYIKRGMRLRQRFTPELNMWFPRITGQSPSDLVSYSEWIGMDSTTMTCVEISEAYDSLGCEVARMDRSGKRGKPVSYRPTYLQNLQWFLTYQTGYMYWRYLMWNFSGRQNDRASQGEVQHGNFITGFKAIDDAMLGADSSLPPHAGAENPGRNRLWMLPLLLGILGMGWLLKSRIRGMEACGLIAVLFVMTGLAITVYLNQDPGEPRERDYSFLGSFLAYAIWIGFGGIAISRLCHTPWGFLIPLAVTGWMCAENWDDHDRSGRTAARNLTVNLLNSLEPETILFVNGDNGTFPLWYAQEVEGVRRDVRVVNLAYLQTPQYAANMMADWRDSRRVPTTLRRGDILWGALRSVTIGSGNDTMPATEALRALRDGASAFPTRFVSMKIGPDTITYDLKNLCTGGNRVDFRRLVMFDIIATNSESKNRRPVYWVWAQGAPQQLGLSEMTTDMLHGRRLGRIDRAKRDSIMMKGLENLLPPNESDRPVYMDHIPASQITAQRAALTAAGLRTLADGNTRLALDFARAASETMGKDHDSYGIVLISDSAFNTRLRLAELLEALADSIESDAVTGYKVGAREKKEGEEFRREAARHRAMVDTLREQWHRYRLALPPRLKSKVAPVY